MRPPGHPRARRGRRRRIEKPFRDDPQLDLIRKRGFDHEQAYIGRAARRGPHGRRDDGARRQRRRRSSTPPRPRRSRRCATARDVIFQATLFDGRWRGHADFLLRRDDRPSELGGWSYDVADTKLAERVKAAAILQMCVYADLLETVQGIPPETMAVVTGDRRPHIPPARRLCGLLPRRQGALRGAGLRDRRRRRPTPTPSRSITAASALVDDVRRPAARGRPPLARRGHHERTATAPRRGGVPTRSPRSRTASRDEGRQELPGSSSGCGSQARSSSGDRRGHVLRYELIPPIRTTCRPAGPRRSSRSRRPLDVFFDIEADPWALEDGLEYLFGWAEAAMAGRRSTTPSGPTTGPREGRVRGVRRSSSERLGATRRCTSTTTAATSRAPSSG